MVKGNSYKTNGADGLSAVERGGVVWREGLQRPKAVAEMLPQASDFAKYYEESAYKVMRITSLKMQNMNTESGMRIRPAESKDRDFIISLAPRMVEFGPPPWRDPAQMASTDQRVLDNVLSTRPPKTAIFIAEDSNGTALGFIHLNTNTDYYTLEEHGHISDIVVAGTEEGRGVGRALIEAGEEWARQQGYRLLTLNVFVENLPARRLYEKLGYGGETIKYVKEMR